MKKPFAIAFLAFLAASAFGYNSPLPSYDKYVFTRPVNTNRIEGKLMGPGGDYAAMRVEDVAFIYEAVQERDAIIDGSYSGFCVTNRGPAGLKSGSFPLDYTNRYPQAIHDGTEVVAYYDTNIVTNVTARLGIDTLWPQKLTLDCRKGWIDKDERWPTAIEDADKKGTGDAAYTNLPTAWLAPTYLNPQATNTVTNLVKFVVWPLKKSVSEAYKFLAKTEKCVKGLSRAYGGTTNAWITTDYQGETGHINWDVDSDSVTVYGMSVDDLNHSDPVVWRGGHEEVSKTFSFGLDRVFMQVFNITSAESGGPGEYVTMDYSEGSSGTFEAMWYYTTETLGGEIILDTGISYVVATAGMSSTWGRIKRIDVYYDGSLVAPQPGNNYRRGTGFDEKFGGHGGVNPTTLDEDFKGLHVVVPLPDQEKVLVAHTNEIWNAEEERYEPDVDNVWYTVGVKLTPDVNAWADEAIKCAGKGTWGEWCQQLANAVGEAPNDPRTPASYRVMVGPHEFIDAGWYGWDIAEATANGTLEVVFTASPHRAVVTCDLTTRITDSNPD